MTTLVLFHAHPDDEAITTAGTAALAVAEGHRVVLVIATGGECGQVVDGVLAPGEALGDRRRREARASAAVLGIDRVEFLGYRDSGMMGETTNDDPACFWRADLDEAARRLADICEQEGADVLTCYDDHGGYGHPDHIQVHRVGHRAAELAGVERLYEATMNRDHVMALMERAAIEGVEGAEARPAVDADSFGTPAAAITTTVDVRDHLGVKRAAMRAHESQIGPESFFLALPDDAFEAAFGQEWYLRVGAPAGAAETSLW